MLHILIHLVPASYSFWLSVSTTLSAPLLFNQHQATSTISQSVVTNGKRTARIPHPNPSRILQSFHAQHKFYRVAFTAAVLFQKHYFRSFFHQRLPKAFTKFFNGITPSKATLVDHAGNCWDIELEKIKDGLVLTNGWQQFATDKCLEEADFLVFEYNGKSIFYVKIFSKSGIRKEPANVGKHVPIVILDEDSDDQSAARKMLRGLKRKHSPTTLKINEISDSDVLTFVGSSEGTRGKKIERANSEADGNDYEKKASGLAKRVPMKNPHFVIPFSGWRLTSSAVELPKLVLRQLNIRLKSNINLRDENDKLWPVMIRTSTSKGGRTFLASGWSDFRNAKNIKEGQLCVFKFVIGRANVAEEVLVRVRPPSKFPKLN